MNESPSAIDLAELLIQEGKKREAAALLAAYLKRHPTSARAWWVLSQAVETPAQERDCLERVLALEPEHAPAQARLAQLEPPPGKHVRPFTASLPAERARPPEPAPPPAPKSSSSTQEQRAPDWMTRPAPDLKPTTAEPKTIPSPLPKQKADAASRPEPASPSPLRAPQTPAFSSAPPPPFPVSSKEESFVPPWAEPPVLSEKSKEADEKPPRRKFRAANLLLIFIFLCLLAAFAGYLVYVLIVQPSAKRGMQQLADTQTVAALLTERAPTLVRAAQTFTPRPSLSPTETATLTPEPSLTFTPTLLDTPTRTPIPSSQVGLTAGRYPPDFTLPNVLTGEPVHLYDYLGRQPVLLFFWATWCPYCKTEIPYLQGIYEKHQAEELLVLAIDVDPADTPAMILETIQNQGMTFTVLFDATGGIGEQYRIAAIPHHVFIGRSGKIVSVVNGMLSESKLELQVMSILRVFPTSTP